MYEIYYRVCGMVGSLTKRFLSKRALLAFIQELLYEDIEFFEVRKLYKIEE